MRILLATDGSKDAAAAAAFLKDMAVPPSTTVRITAVVVLPDIALDDGPIRDFERSLHDEARGIVEAVRATLATCGVAIETDVAVGDPREQIVRLAAEWRADLIVVGARGIGLVKRFLLGGSSPHCP